MLTGSTGRRPEVKPIDQQAAVEGDAAHALVEDVAADRVVDHVGAAPAGDLLHPLAEAAGDVDGGVGRVFGAR